MTVLFVAFRGYVHWFVHTAEDRAHNGEGLPSEARRWSAVLAAVTDPVAVPVTGPVTARKYSNGEWVVGKCSSSHDFSHRGGTMVIRESRGRTHVYFGHVCGSGEFGHVFENAKSIDDMIAGLNAVPQRFDVQGWVPYVLPP